MVAHLTDHTRLAQFHRRDLLREKRTKGDDKEEEKRVEVRVALPSIWAVR